MRPNALILAGFVVAAAFAGSGCASAQIAGRAAVKVGRLALAAERPEAPQTRHDAREPTAGQLAARERLKKCGVEWKEAKKANTTGGLKWPQYWSKCNARLKGNQA